MRILAIACLILGLSLPAHAQSRKELAEARVLELLATYSPISAQLMENYSNIPKKVKINDMSISLGGSAGFSQYIEGYDEAEIVESLGTVVHESNHGYNSQGIYLMLERDPSIPYDFNDEISVYYFSPEHEVRVKHQEVFNSHEIANNIPREMRTFRFTPYLSPRQPFLGSQKDGIYGLLDEWNSYYHGTRTQLDMYPYYQAKAKTNRRLWLDFVQNPAGTYFAHLEFKLFVLEYFLHAKRNHPATYQALMAQKEMLEVYVTIDREFGALCERYFALKAQLVEELTQQGIRAELDDEYFYIEGNGVGLFGEEWNLLHNYLQAERYTRMEAEIQRAYSRL